MCTPMAGIMGAISTIATAGNQVLNIYEENRNTQYKIQAAINNAQAQKNEALRQKQLGIENSRIEKAQGFQEANRLKAKASASGFDMNSQSLNYNYQDTIKNAYDKADNIYQSYEAKADSYFDNANSYLDSAREIQRDYKKNLYNKALSGLATTADVATKWYENGEKWKDKRK